MKAQVRDDNGQILCEKYFEGHQTTIVAVLSPETETTRAVFEIGHGYMRPDAGFDFGDRVITCGYVFVAFWTLVRTAALADGWVGSLFWLWIAISVGHHGRRVWRALQ